MFDVYHPTTKDETRGRSHPRLTELLSKPAPLKKLCRDFLRKTMRILTDSRTIRPLVASLENSGELDKNSGDFLLRDPPQNWREELVMDLYSSSSIYFNIFILSGR